MASGFSIKGKAEMAAKIRRRVEVTPRLIGSALYQEMEIERTECVQRTPRDTGALRDSEHVEGPKYDSSRISASVVAGGPSAPYAAHVHEDLHANHPIGEAKFIERPLMESRPFMAQRVARRIRNG